MRRRSTARNANQRPATGRRRTVRLLVAGTTALAVGAGVTASAMAEDATLLGQEGKSVEYRGLALTVPKDWKVVDLEANPETCVRYDENAVYLGEPSADQNCPARAVGRTESIHIQPSDETINSSRETTIAQPGDIPEEAFGGSTSRETRLALSGAGLSVTASHRGNPELIESVLSNAKYDGPNRPTQFGQGNRSATGSPDFSASASATRAHGRGFDTCAAPSKSTMKAWKRNSPFGTVGIYIGGLNRACGDGNLDRSWVKYTTTMGWRLLPIYVGRQAKCAFQTDMASISDSKATAQGRAAARDAVKKAKKFGLRGGSTLYNDMEGYGNSSSCRTSVMKFLSGWTKQLHDSGYLSGVYSSASSGINDLAKNYASSSYVRPDVIWMANWDGKRTLFGSKYVSDRKWARNQRVKQYRGPHTETHGGRSVEIDSNMVDAMVGSTDYAKKATAKESLNVRSGPSTKYGTKRAVAPGSSLSVVCQVSGQKVRSTKVWNKLTDGGYVSNAFVNTGGGNGYEHKLPRCQFPYQVTTAMVTRSGPSTKHAKNGSIPGGGLANIVCQKTGEKIKGNRVWNRMENGKWLSNAYVATPKRPGYTPGIPRC